MIIFISCLDEGEEPFLQDVEDGGQEEGQSQEDEQLVRQLPAVVLQDQLPAQVDGSRHVLELLVGLLHRPGGGGCGREEEEVERCSWCQRKDQRARET